MENFLLKCQICGKSFFTYGESEFYKSKNLQPPKICKECKEERDTTSKKALKEIVETWIDDAKQEDPDYFYSVEHVSEILNNKKYFVIGRKGSGKSAIAKYLCDLENGTTFTERLSFKNFPFNCLYELKNMSFAFPNQYITLWKYIIYSYICKMMVRNQSFQGEAKELLEKLYGGDATQELARLIPKWTMKEFQVQILEVGGSIGQEKESIDLDWIEKTNVLEDFLLQNVDNYTYFIVFDELDEDYRDFETQQERETYLRLIKGLFKAVQDIRSAFAERGKKILPVVFLRNDIYEQVTDADKNKWNDFKIDMQWDRDKLNKLVLHRLAVTLKKVGGDYSTGNVWHKFFYGQKVPMGNKNRQSMDIFNYITRSTQLRPRDYINYIKKCAEIALEKNDSRISANTVKAADDAFSDYLKGEIVDEIYPVLPEINEIFSVLSQIRKQTFSPTVFEKAYVEHVEKFNLPNRGPEFILRKLFEYSIIGNQPSMKEKPIFKYEKQGARFNYKENLMVHRGLFKALQIF